VGLGIPDKWEQKFLEFGTWAILTSGTHIILTGGTNNLLTSGPKNLCHVDPHIYAKWDHTFLVSGTIHCCQVAPMFSNHVGPTCCHHVGHNLVVMVSQFPSLSEHDSNLNNLQKNPNFE
jgi:hypothetical protein